MFFACVRINHHVFVSRQIVFVLFHDFDDSCCLNKALRMAGRFGENGVAGSVCATPQGFGGNGMVRVIKDSEEFILVQHRFYSSIGSLVPHCSLVDLHRVSYSTLIARVRWEAFQRCVKATALKNGGDANVKFAFREASKDEVLQIVKKGFDVRGIPEDGGYFGIGLYLTPEPVSINRYTSTRTICGYISCLLL